MQKLSEAHAVIDALQRGNERYLRDGRKSRRPASPTQSQPVIVAVLSCSDLKEEVSTLFGLQSDQVFYMATPGTMVTREEIGGASFAADIHGASLVLVLGHSGCDVVDVYQKGGQVASRELMDALDDSRRAAVAAGALKVSKPDLVRMHTCRMAQSLRAGLGSRSKLVVSAAQFDESCGRVLFF